MGGISGFKELLVGLGIGLIIKGVYDTVKAIIEFVKDPSWENFAGILKGLSIILFGISIILMVIKGFNPVTWIMLAVAGIVLLVAEIIKHWDEIKEILGKVGSWINEHIIQPVKDFFVGLWNDITTGVSNAWNKVISTIQGIGQWIYDHIISPVINFFIGLWNTITTGVTNVWNAVIGIISGIAGWINSNIIQPIVGFFNNLWNNIRNGLNSVGSFFSNIFNWIRNVASNVIGSIIGFFNSLGNTAKNIINGIWSVVKNVINFVIRGINILISGLNKIHFNTPDWVPLIGGKSFGFSVPHINYLAHGGIVNVPNKGVPLGYNTIYGEAGREVALPLDDSRNMEEVGKAIGKYVTINATIINKMNGRVLSRELRTYQSDYDFSTNS